jgi:hypothetical protein
VCSAIGHIYVDDLSTEEKFIMKCKVVVQDRVVNCANVSPRSATNRPMCPRLKVSDDFPDNMCTCNLGIRNNQNDVENSVAT